MSDGPHWPSGELTCPVMRPCLRRRHSAVAGLLPASALRKASAVAGSPLASPSSVPTSGSNAMLATRLTASPVAVSRLATSAPRAGSVS